MPRYSGVELHCLRGRPRFWANEPGISANTRFEVCIAKDYPETGFDLAAFFDCLFTTWAVWATWATRPARQRMGQSLKPDGAWMAKTAFRSPRDQSVLARAGRFRCSCATLIAT